MHYETGFKPQAIKDLQRLAPAWKKRIVAKIETMQNELAGDVKRLTNYTPEYRLRVGDYRVLFAIEADMIVVYRVMHRSKAYE